MALTKIWQQCFILGYKLALVMMKHDSRSSFISYEIWKVKIYKILTTVNRHLFFLVQIIVEIFKNSVWRLTSAWKTPNSFQTAIFESFMLYGREFFLPQNGEYVCADSYQWILEGISNGEWICHFLNWYSPCSWEALLICVKNYFPHHNWKCLLWPEGSSN